MTEILVNGVLYKGQFDELPDANVSQIGDTITYDGSLLRYNGESWEPLIDSIAVSRDSNLAIRSDYMETGTLTASIYPPTITKLENCSNCGGTVDGKGYCKFCGSKVYSFSKYSNDENYCPF